jgi:SAM-dependent methyltransferase
MEIDAAGRRNPGLEKAVMTRNRYHTAEKQEEMWQDGTYDYLSRSLTSIKFPMCAHLVRKYTKAPRTILEIGAGTGDIAFMVNSNQYLYNDISQEAADRFADLCSRYPLSAGTIEAQVGNFDNLDLAGRKFDVVLYLGAAVGLVDQDVLVNTFNNVCTSFMIIEACPPEMPELLSELPPPTGGIDFNMWEKEWNPHAYIRTLSFWVKGKA